METLVSLEQLRADGCMMLKMEQLRAWVGACNKASEAECYKLEDLEVVEHCKSLKLDIFECPKLQWLREQWTSTALRM
jgi:hypothetical protein